jgi:Ni,Fe-hydrogenase I cytochrome b subunit
MLSFPAVRPTLYHIHLLYVHGSTVRLRIYLQIGTRAGLYNLSNLVADSKLMKSFVLIIVMFCNYVVFIAV